MSLFNKKKNSKIWNCYNPEINLRMVNLKTGSSNELKRSMSHYLNQGYDLQVDIEYPTTLNNEHSDLPSCPEKKRFGSKPKLCTTERADKKNYIIH